MFLAKLRSLLPLLLGPALFLMTLLLEPPSSELSKNAWLICGLAAWMATWWITEAISIPATALIPLAVLPLLNIESIAAVASPYADPLIFLFFGGFVLSIAMERWNLHKRIALLTMSIVGSKPSQQIAGIMLVTGFLSMWMSNTATAVMMLPIGLSIVAMQNTDKNNDFAKAILLSIAYAASIGGVATLIGTPPNALLVGYLQNVHNITISFADWMILGVPLAAVMLMLAWIWLTRFQYKLDSRSQEISRHIYRQKLAELGPMQFAEKIVLAVFILAALCWTLSKPIKDLTGLPMNDTVTAICVALLLFILPAGKANGQRVLSWDDCEKLPWGILLLFGGGLTLASQIQKSGLADFIALQISQLGTLDMLTMIILVTTLIIFLTEITSNTATAAAFLPLLGPVAVSMDMPVPLLVIPAAIAASFAFMLPVATPPNAIVFGSGHLKIMDMVKAGFTLNILGIICITIACITLAPYIYS